MLVVVEAGLVGWYVLETQSLVLVQLSKSVFVHLFLRWSEDSGGVRGLLTTEAGLEDL